MEITVWRDTPSAAASSACDRPCCVRCSRTRFRMMSRYLYLIGMSSTLYRTVRHAWRWQRHAGCHTRGPCLAPGPARPGMGTAPGQCAAGGPGAAQVHDEMSRRRWEPGRARHVPVREVTHGDSRSFTEQPAELLTCGTAGPVVAATSFASRGQGFESP